MVDSDGSTLCCIYYAMHKAKETSKDVSKGENEKYLPFWKIIDDRWNNLYIIAYLKQSGLFETSFFS